MRALVFGAALAFLLVGCSGFKQYFHPEQSENYPSKAIGTLAATSAIISNSNYQFKSSPQGELNISNKSTNFEKTLHFDAQTISAAIKSNLLVSVDALNNIKLYDLSREQLLVDKNFGTCYGVISPLPQPVFTDSLALVPSCNGKLVVFNYHTAALLKVFNIGTKEFFNNIIYLATENDRMVALSTSKAVAIVGVRNFSLIDSFKTAASDGENIYLFTSSGDVIRTDFALHPLARKNFEFANFKAASLQNGALYALEFSGKLLKLDPQTLEIIKIWDFKSKLRQDCGFEPDFVIVNSKKYPLL